MNEKNAKKTLFLHTEGMGKQERIFLTIGLLCLLDTLFGVFSRILSFILVAIFGISDAVDFTVGLFHAILIMGMIIAFLLAVYEYRERKKKQL